MDKFMRPKQAWYTIDSIAHNFGVFVILCLWKQHRHTMCVLCRVRISKATIRALYILDNIQ